MTDVFDDIEAADAWDDDPTIDALQVAYRLHELRVQVDALAGRTIRRWRELNDPERDVALAVATAAVGFIQDREPDNPALLARHVHTMRVYLTADDELPQWDELPPDHQQIAVDLLDLIVDWLEAEGPR